MRSRSMVLGKAGFVVEESYSVDRALAVVASDSIDVLLICHTVPRAERKKLVASVRSLRPQLPMLCITAEEYARPTDGCAPVLNSPVDLVDGVRAAVGTSGRHLP